MLSKCASWFGLSSHVTDGAIVTSLDVIPLPATGSSTTVGRYWPALALSGVAMSDSVPCRWTDCLSLEQVVWAEGVL
jgi:uncharacterized protein YodC (DUF2158 family)